MKLRFLFLPFLPLAAAGCGERETGKDDVANDASAHQPAVPARAVAPPPQSAPPRSDVIPDAFHGTFDASAAACGQAGDLSLAVSAKELRFHESAAVVRGVTIETPSSIRVGAEFQGEGERWKAEHHLRLSDGGRTLRVTGKGMDIIRVRCVVEPAPEPSTRWESTASGEGAALYLAHAHLGGERAVTLFCPARSDQLVVNVPTFRPIGSEERMTIGAGGTAVALVADSRGDRARGGVTGSGPIPPELVTILRGKLAVSYGAQTSGPYAPPPAELAKTFLASCRD